MWIRPACSASFKIVKASPRVTVLAYPWALVYRADSPKEKPFSTGAFVLHVYVFSVRHDSLDGW